MHKAFTLAEVLITLAIIGVVAALTIPSVISNTQQQEFKTGLRKAVSVLNSSITMSMALDGETPYDNANTFGYLMKHMNVIKKGQLIDFYWAGGGVAGNIYSNAVFYTADGMRFEFFPGSNQNWHHVLYESNGKVKACIGSTVGNTDENGFCGGCGSYGLDSNSDNTTKTPCLIMVDVNGDRKPNPQNALCKSSDCKSQNIYKYSDPDGKKLTDLFLIMITDKKAIPYGIAAQKAMYNSNK